MNSLRIGPRRTPGLSLLAACLSVAGQIASAGALPAPATGANVDESLVQKTYTVDPANADAADDDKHGTPDAPFATLAFACAAAARDQDHEVGAKVIVASGTYREAVDLQPPAGDGPKTNAPLVIEAAEREQAVIDGADTEGWTPSTWKTGGGRWYHALPDRRVRSGQASPPRPPHPAAAPSAAPGEAYRRGLLFFVNGTALRQVSQPDQLAPGCFWRRPPLPTPPQRGKIDPNSPASLTSQVIIVQPPADTTLEGAIFQAGERDHNLAIHGRRNVVLRGLLLQHAAGPSGTGSATAGLLLDGCSNVLVEDVLSQWNDGAGLVITGPTAAPQSADVTLRRVLLLHNGGPGLAATNLKNLLVEDGEASFNNFRGEWADWIDPAGPAGVKIADVHGSTWRRLRAVNNFCRGVWLAGDNADAVLEESVLTGNVLNGVLIENNPGPVLVRRCLVADTKMHPGVREETAWTAGVSLVATPGVTLESNIIADNAGAQLGVWDLAGHAPAASPGKHTAPVLRRSEQLTELHNVFFGSDAGQAMYAMPPPDTAVRGPSAFYDGTLDARENCFWNPLRTKGFVLHGGAPQPPGPDAAVDPPGMDLEDWRALLLERGPSPDGSRANHPPEAGSRWQDPLFADPAEDDFRLREQSPVAGWDLPSDEGSAAQ